MEERAGRVGLGVGVGRWVREGGATMGAGKMGLVGWGREWWLGGKGRVGEWDLESVKKECWWEDGTGREELEGRILYKYYKQIFCSHYLRHSFKN